ncbi:MAG: hypothetical protein R3C11_20300 [Planctomycetaceae bacterium]
MLFQFELGICLPSTQQHAEAANSYEVVFNAILHPEEYALNAQIQSRLMSDRSQSMERIGRAFLDGERLDLAEQASEAASKFGTGKPALLGFNLACLPEKGEYEKGSNNLQAYFDARLQNKGREAYELLKEFLVKLNRTDELIPRLENWLKMILAIQN